jgi:hypothetical protein
LVAGAKYRLFKSRTASGTLQVFYFHFLEHVGSAVETYASLASWAMVVSALNDFPANDTGLANAFFRHNLHLL